VACWYFSVYQGIELINIHRVETSRLDADFFAAWEAKWHRDGGKDINNPKIPVKYVRANGVLIYQDAPGVGSTG